MTYLNVAERLLTWLDVERTLKQLTQLWTRLPEGIHAIDCYHDGMDISHSATEDAVRQWLQGIFGKAFSGDDLQLTLRAGGGIYPVRFEKVEPQAQRQLPLYPLWREVAYLQETNAQANVVTAAQFQLPADFEDGPQLMAFHSFKGGVGRTTALMTYVTARLHPNNASDTVKVLVIDADLEAPGVTFWLDETNRPQVSFVQFLEAMHYPPVSNEASLNFFADELRKTSLNVDGSHRELFVLPAALDLTEIQDMPVQPSHLARNPSNPWVLTDHLHSLGKRLGVDAVFIDLRAGLSELSSPLIFDPRVGHYFVTTVAKQSVAGTCEVLSKLHAFNSALPKQARRDAKPSVVVSLLTPELKRLTDFDRAKEAIEQVYPPVDETLDEGVEWLEADFSATLMSIASVREAFDKLKQSSLYLTSAQEWASNIVDSRSMPAKARTDQSDTVGGNSKAQSLFDVCEKEYAEHSGTDDWLVTEPLRNLGKHFSKDIPNAVLVGAKGAGKTFTYLQICKAKTWSKYLERVGELPAGHDSSGGQIIFPVLWSTNVEGASKVSVMGAQKVCLTLLDYQSPPELQSDLLRRVSNNLRSESLNWDDLWESVIVASMGGIAASLKEINLLLHQRRQSLVLVFDGVEDIFSDPTSEVQQRAIESLLKLVNRLGELPNQSIGSLVFVRIDYVQASIKQNLGQFLSRFSAFQLVWNPESFLRLAFWLCAKASIIEADAKQAQSLSIEELIQSLESVWGHKLGKNESKEGHSARWVYAALCDLRGSFQARDLVRFFKFAAQEQLKNKTSSWGDRVLSPEAMRRAIPECSRQKVEEATKEIAPLRAWNERMSVNRIVERPIPFSALSVALEPAELAVLRELGVIYEDLDPALGDRRLFLPEIYRAGLSFDLSGGRPRIQALLKKNLGKMPF
jgi:MinD-like ATPase involved in chromosome partitioning or flagellar assembly